MFEDFCRGFLLFLEGTSAFYKEKSLWKYAVSPLLVLVLVYGAAFGVSVYFATVLAQKAGGYLEAQSSWLSKIAGLVSGGITVVCLLLVLALLLFTASVFYETLAGPFCDGLIAAYLEKKGVPPPPALSWKSTFIFMKESIFFNINTLWGTIILTLLSLFLPAVGQVLLFLFVSYRLGISWLMPAGFVCGYTLADQKKALADKKRLLLGFGTAAYLFWLIPFAPFIFLPGLVLGGTELLLEITKEK